MTNVDISSAVEKGLSEQLERADINSDHILLALRRIAFADILDRAYPGKLRALELLGKSLGLFQSPVEKAAKMSYFTLDVPSHGKRFVK